MLAIFILTVSVLSSSIAEAMEPAFTEQSHALQQTSPIELIPDEMLLYPFEYVNFQDLARAMQVCKKWNAIITSDLPADTAYLFKIFKQSGKKYKEFNKTFSSSRLNHIINILTSERVFSKEQAYQALLVTNFIKSCPDISFKVLVQGSLALKKESLFPYIRETFLKKYTQENSVDTSPSKRIVIKVKKDQEQYYLTSNSTEYAELGYVVDQSDLEVILTVDEPNFIALSLWLSAEKIKKFLEEHKTKLSKNLKNTHPVMDIQKGDTSNVFDLSFGKKPANLSVLTKLAELYNKSNKDNYREPNWISDEGAKALAQSLRTNLTLTTLNLNSNEGAYALAPSLESNRSLYDS